MRRAGWAVWLAYDLPGSHEEMPPNLMDELLRDRRWCRGNLINSRLLFAEGLHPAHRAVFMTGIMAYLSAPLWFLFLLLSTALLAVHTLVPPTYFLKPEQLYPLWPQWHPDWAVALFGATAALLFLPKILAGVLVMKQGSRTFGGGLRVVAGVLTESVLSALLAPIRMLFHTQFVAGTLIGGAIRWRSPPREDAETRWGEAIRRHGWHSLLGFCGRRASIGSTRGSCLVACADHRRARAVDSDLRLLEPRLPRRARAPGAVVSHPRGIATAKRAPLDVVGGPARRAASGLPRGNARSGGECTPPGVRGRARGPFTRRAPGPPPTCRTGARRRAGFAPPHGKERAPRRSGGTRPTAPGRPEQRIGAFARGRSRRCRLATPSYRSRKNYNRAPFLQGAALAHPGAWNAHMLRMSP